MSKPPLKAIESIRNYYEKTQCRRCVFGERDRAMSDDIDYVACQLQMTNPCDWEITKED